MKKICASCGKDLGSIPGTENTEGLSHGLCKSCAIHFLADVGMPLEEFIEGLDVPVVTVTTGSLIGTANEAAKKILGKDLPEISGFRGGDVFECKYAVLPGGCGQTVHCSGCTIRKTVADTLATGRTHRNVPAFLNHNEPEGDRKIDMLITTEKKGGIVFLSIVRMGDGL